MADNDFSSVSVLKTMAILAVAIIAAETALLLLLHSAGLRHHLPVWGAVLIDAILLPPILLPLLLRIVHRPYRLRLSAAQKGEKAFREQNRQLLDDLSRRRDAELELTRLIGRQDLILSTAKEAIIGLDRQGHITFVNEAGVRCLGWSRGELIGADHHPLLQHSHPSGAPYQRSRCPIHFTLTTGQGFDQVEEFFWRKDGRGFPVEISCAPLQEDSVVIGAVVTFRDISERKEAEARIHHLAYFDSLTGLPNRRLFQDRFAQILAQCKREKMTPALMYLDLDNFKAVNDSLGHAAGDGYLADRANKIRSCVRANDTVARMSGDEFVWVGKLSRAEEVSLVAEKIIAALAEPVEIKGKKLTTTASIGIAVYPNDGTDLDELLKAADAAMYEAKSAGKSAFRYAGDPPPLSSAGGASAA